MWKNDTINVGFAVKSDILEELEVLPTASRRKSVATSLRRTNSQPSSRRQSLGNVPAQIPNLQKDSIAGFKNSKNTKSTVQFSSAVDVDASKGQPPPISRSQSNQTLSSTGGRQKGDKIKDSYYFEAPLTKTEKPGNLHFQKPDPLLRPFSASATRRAFDTVPPNELLRRSQRSGPHEEVPQSWVTSTNCASRELLVFTQDEEISYFRSNSNMSGAGGTGGSSPKRAQKTITARQNRDRPGSAGGCVRGTTNRYKIDPKNNVNLLHKKTWGETPKAVVQAVQQGRAKQWSAQTLDESHDDRARPEQHTLDPKAKSFVHNPRQCKPAYVGNPPCVHSRPFNLGGNQ